MRAPGLGIPRVRSEQTGEMARLCWGRSDFLGLPCKATPSIEDGFRLIIQPGERLLMSYNNWFEASASPASFVWPIDETAVFYRSYATAFRPGLISMISTADRPATDLGPTSGPTRVGPMTIEISRLVDGQPDQAGLQLRSSRSWFGNYPKAGYAVVKARPRTLTELKSTEDTTMVSPYRGLREEHPLSSCTSDDGHSFGFRIFLTEDHQVSWSAPVARVHSVRVTFQARRRVFARSSPEPVLHALVEYWTVDGAENDHVPPEVGQ